MSLILSALKVDWFCLLNIVWHLLKTRLLIVLYVAVFSASRMSPVAIKFNVCVRHCDDEEAMRN